MTTLSQAKSLLNYKPRTQVKLHDLLGTGSTLLNLALSGRGKGGLVKGKVHLFVGDPSSGKTFLCLTTCAEASIDKDFTDYRLIYDNCEDGALMNFETFFGKAVADSVEPPAGTKQDPIHSTTVEEFYYHLDDAINSGPCIYILDSMDALLTEEDEEQFKKERKAHESGKESSGSYGTHKAKKNSQNLRRVVSKLKTNGSILIIICQTRDNIGFGARFEPKTRGGGRALKFYASVEIWFSIKERIKKMVRGKNRQQGIIAKVSIKKNRITGKEWDITLPIYWSTGIDDIGSCVDYLIEEGHWKVKAGKIYATEFDFSGDREKIVRHIEDTDGESTLKGCVIRVWREVEAATAIRRKNRYA